MKSPCDAPPIPSGVRRVFAGPGAAWLLFLATACVAAPPPSGRNIAEAGAVADGKTPNTAVINRVIDEAAAAGGGVVYVPPGVYLTGTIYLKSRVTLHLENGAVLLGSTDLQDYPENPAPTPTDTLEFRRYRLIYPASLEFGRHSLVHADGQHDVAIVGEGCIDGQGNHTNFTKKDLEARGVSPRDAYLKRPYGLCFVRCTGVQVRGITLRNLAFWSQDYLDCDGVLVDGVTVDSKKFDYNNDGIDIDGSRHVRVTNCYFNVGDDAICLKASYRDCEDVLVTNCVCSSLANGIKFGTASNGGFKNIAISNITMDGINAAGLALEIVDGGTMDGVAVSNIAMNRVGAALFVRLGDRGSQWMTKVDSDGQPNTVGILRNVSIDNIVANLGSNDPRPFAASITGLPGHPVEHVSISNVRIVSHHPHTLAEADGIDPAAIPEQAGEYPEYSMFGPLPAYGLYIRHARGVTLRNIDVRFSTADYRSALVADDVQDLDVDDWKSRVQPGSRPVILLRNVKGARLRGGAAPAGTGTYLRVEGDSADIFLTGTDLAHAETAVALDPKLPPSVVAESANRR
ncbi:MAG: glycoside hydrolase family 28 protein [Opitutaceae bacterium]|nr:glycoside hydrolase family 28 protein [Opitutaceae bacterium]